MIITLDDYLAHYGTPRKSGRYPWGSGGDDSQRNRSFLDMVANMHKQGLTEAQIAEGLDINTTQLRAMKSIARNAEKQADISRARRLQEHGYSNVKIGEIMGKGESTVRGLLSDNQKDRNDVLQSTAQMLRDEVKEKRFLDVGSGVENTLAISQTKLSTAVAILEDEGYKLHYVKMPQLGTSKETTFKVLAPPGVPYSEVFQNRYNIRQIQEFSDDGGRSWLGMKPPLSIDSSRVAVRYKEDGGSDADGVIYARPGVPDVSIGANRYAQVRIMVDGTHYLKGMVMYKDDLPPGVDLVFNTNKSNTGNKLDAMKALKDDVDNPFGAVIRQKIDPVTGNVLSSMNIVGSKEGMGEEGGWETWSRNLATQFLSKQSPKLAQTQLDMTYERSKNELDDIMKLTNPAVKRKLLESFADGTDSAAVHLKAAALPRQASHVILPINSLKENEIYAPNYRNGERVALVRYPHAGLFEIPELTVNNNHPPAKKIMGNAKDAVGINAKVAQRLSGADFDGDAVLVIPNNGGLVKSSPALAALKNFDPVGAYPKYDGMQVMDARTKGIEMGKVSNLITDMTIQKASNADLARAVRHSMVVIDAEKHELNWKQSAKDNNIAQLKAKYQGGTKAGASTLISRASAEQRVDNRKARPAADGGAVDRVTGEKRYVPTGESYVNRKGQVVKRSFKSTKLAETNDANTLVSKNGGTVIERVYADHSNRLKQLANQARLNSLDVKAIPYSPSAKAVYSREVESLNAKLDLAIRNRPLERQAQVLGNAVVYQKRQEDPNMDAATIKKIKAQALTEARLRTGAAKQRIVITDDEWNAIQSGAITNHRLTQILANADLDRVKQLATPKTKLVMTNIKKQRAAAMLASGYTQAEVADQLGVSLSTLKASLV